MAECADRTVGAIGVGHLSGICDETDWGDLGNLGIHAWEFDDFSEMLESKAAEPDITVERVDEQVMSKSCASCGTPDERQRVERRLDVCQACKPVVNGSENIRRTVLPDLTHAGEDRDPGWMAQPAVRLFDKSTGRVRPQEQVTPEP